MKRPTKLALIFILIAFGLGLGFYYSWQKRGVSADSLRELATWGLAQYLAQEYPDSRPLIISNPYSQFKGVNPSIVDQEVSGINGLKEGFGSTFSQVELEVAYPSLKKGAREHPELLITNPDVTTPLSFLVETNSFDDLAQEYPQYDLWISLIGLPLQLDSVGVWNQSGPPRFAMLLPDLKVIGSNQKLLDLVMSEKLVAFVLTKPEVTFDTTRLTGDLKEDFQARYLLVTRENIEEVLDTHPGLFVPIR